MWEGPSEADQPKAPFKTHAQPKENSWEEEKLNRAQWKP